MLVGVGVVTGGFVGADVVIGKFVGDGPVEIVHVDDVNCAQVLRLYSWDISHSLAMK